MFKLSQLIDAKRRDGSESNTESSPQSRQFPPSPLTASSSTPVSPAASLFSAKGHGRFSSSTSSLISSPGLRNSMESSKNHQLSDVKEEPSGFEAAHDLEHEYFQHFDQGLSEDTYFASVDYQGYDLTDTGMELVHSPKKRRSNTTTSINGLSRISSQISTISSRLKSKRTSDAPDDENVFPDELRSRTNSVTSCSMVNPTLHHISRVDSSIPPSPARTIFEERLSELGVQPIDIEKANSQCLEDTTQLASTPLLPPFMGEEPHSVAASQIQSPLESPSVAGVSEITSTTHSIHQDPRLSGPTPPLSSTPSVSSFHPVRTSTVRTVSMDGPPRFILSDPHDEWANKLGHANFTIQPAPYVPETCDVASFQQLCADWDMAQCNYTKHLVRTTEHYGVTSNIYKLTEEKWGSINREWKHRHEVMLYELEAKCGPILGLTQSNLDPCEHIKIPHLHEHKFPELGDGEIVGPMKISPPGPCANRSLKRNFFKFFQDLVGRS